MIFIVWLFESVELHASRHMKGLYTGRQWRHLLFIYKWQRATSATNMSYSTSNIKINIALYICWRRHVVGQWIINITVVRSCWSICSLCSEHGFTVRLFTIEQLLCDTDNVLFRKVLIDGHCLHHLLPLVKTLSIQLRPASHNCQLSICK